MRKRVDTVRLVVALAGAALGLAAGAPAQQSARRAAPYASDRPLAEPTLFAAGVISTGDFDSHPAFTPDGRTLYFIKSTAAFDYWTIVVSRYRDGRWTEPEVAPFSGRYRDADPFITADGSKLYFISDRPTPGGQSAPRGDLDIWFVERAGDGWGEPKNLGAPVNSEANEWYPTVAADGTVYFGSGRPGGRGRHDIYRARVVNGAYAVPENLGDSINTQFEEFEPYVAPDQSYLIFMSVRPGGLGGGDLYVSHFRDGAWTKAANLGDKINSAGSEYSPAVSPDGNYFFWASTRGSGARPPERPLKFQELAARLRGPQNGLGDIYQIGLGALNLKP